MRHLILMGSIGVLFTACSDTGGAPGIGELEGSWRGVLENGAVEIELIFNLVRIESGVVVTLDVPAQGAENLPIESITRDGQEVTMQAPSLGATFEGSLDAGLSVIDGQWSQSGVELPLRLARDGADGNLSDEPPSVDVDRSAETPGVGEAAHRPQTPQPPFPYEEEELTFRSSDGGIQFGGTLTYPSGDGPFPGAVLISGSGQQNRDHEAAGHRTFAVLADALTRAGYAVLRYDDRGVGKSGGLQTLRQATTQSFALDALAAFDALAVHPRVDSEQLGLIGLSEGGSIAPMVTDLFERRSPSGTAAVADHTGPAFLVLLGAPAVPGDELMMAQSRAIMEAAGAAEAQIEAAAEVNRRVYDALLSDASDDQAAAEIRTLMRDLGMGENQIDAQVAAVTSPWYRAFLRHDPRPLLQALAQPVLALYGSLDTQLPPDTHAGAMEQALGTRPTNGDGSRVVVLDGVNHLLQPARSGSPTEYETIETTIAEPVLEAIISWLDEIVQ